MGYKDHPACPKCRAKARPCRDGTCRSFYSDDYHYGEHGGLGFKCIPYVSLFMNDTDTSGPVQPQDASIGILKVKTKTGGKEKYNLAQEVRTLGLDMQKVKDEVSEMLQINLEDGEPLLGREHTVRIKNVKSKIENLLSAMKYKHTDATLKVRYRLGPPEGTPLTASSQAVTVDLTKVIDDLGKELNSDEMNRGLRERIDGFDLEMETAISAAMDDMRAEYEGELTDLRLQSEDFEYMLLDRDAELKEASTNVKKREQTISEHEKTIRKLEVKQKKAQRFDGSASVDYSQ